MAEFHSPSADVIIIGAGISGLSCARYLLKSHPTMRISLLEARDRVGGRTLTDYSFNGSAVDIGGQWVGPQQPLVMQLIHELGLTIEEQKWFSIDESELVPDSHCKIKSRNECNLSSGCSSNLSQEETDSLKTEINSIESNSRSIFDNKDWASNESTRFLDSQTAVDYLEHNISNPKIRREICMLIQTVMATDPSQLSYLYFLYYVYLCGGVEALGDGSGGAQTYKIPGGAQQLSSQMAAELNSTSIHLNYPVTSISYNKEQGLYQVSSNASDRVGAMLTARRVVLAIPPILWKSIDIAPSLPPCKTAISSSVYHGCAIKCVFIFSAAFWETGNWQPSGDLETLGPIANLFPGKVGNKPALIGLITGNTSCSQYLALSEQEKRDILLQQFQNYFQRPINKASTTNRSQLLKFSLTADVFANQHDDDSSLSDSNITVLHFIWKSWIHEKYSEGCFASLMPPGLLTSHGYMIRSPVVLRTDPDSGLHDHTEIQEGGESAHNHNSIHFTSCELANSWPGYFEGAIDSGYRAAMELLSYN